jgi:hypothetical protein
MCELNRLNIFHSTHKRVLLKEAQLITVGYNLESTTAISPQTTKYQSEITRMYQRFQWSSG